MNVDMIIDDADVLTLSGERASTRRIAVLAGRIVAVGDDCDGLHAARTVGLDGATVVPGFNDAHAHSVWFGMSLLEVDLSQLDTLDSLYARISREAARKRPDEWVIACGFNQMNFGGRYPDADALDRATGGRPLWVKYASGHSCILNRRALSVLGITGREQVEGGAVVRDADGVPTGILEERAMSLVRDRLLPASQEAIADALDAATRAYAGEGLTSVTDAGIGGGWIGHSQAEFGAYQFAREHGCLHTRMQPMLVSDVLSSVSMGPDHEAFYGIAGGMRSGLGDEWLQLGPVKFFLDGSILDNTAKISEDYANRAGNRGFFEGDVEGIRHRVLAAARSGWALAMHAVGDDAVELGIEVLEQLRTEGVTPPLPHRIEHGGVVRPDQLGRLSALGVPVVSQPYFVKAYGDGFIDYIGERRADWSFRMHSYAAAGMPTAGSSDRPVADGRPLAGMQSAVLRCTASGRIYGADERMTPREALEAYTIGSAQVTGWGTRKGRLAPGYLADLTVLDTDPLTADPETIADIGVLATIAGGRVTFDAPGLFDAVGGQDDDER